MDSRSLLRNVATLSVGSAVGQVLPILVSPVLSRQYGVEDFAALGVFIAIVSLASNIVGGRFELAILLPESDADGLNLLGLTVSLAFLVSTFIAVVLAAVHFFVPGFLDSWWLWGIPCTLFAIGTYLALTYWLNRKEAYRTIAINRVLKGVITAGVPLAAPFMLGPQRDKDGRWLIAGFALGFAIGALFMAYRLLKDTSETRNSVSRQAMLEMARTYQDFPRYSILAAVANSLSNQMPLLVMKALFGAGVAGSFAFCHRVLAAPLAVVGDSFADIFKQRAAQERIASGSCRRSWEVTARLLALGCLPLLVTVLPFGPSIFAFVFGEEWRQAGVYAQWLTPYYALAFIASPLSRTLYVAEKQRWDLAWQIGLLLLIALSLALASWLKNSLLMIILFSAAYSIMYIVLLWLSRKASTLRREPAPG
ncbi:MAG: hypothetical protein HONBIEJF_00815 [Fimbriimonadaceae bacterium]|nr:hypothetical protein [Fimbriimonadaceae bacterium]